MSLFVQTLAGGQTVSSDTGTGVLTSTAASTVGNRLVIGISSPGIIVPRTVVDSRGNTYSRVSKSVTDDPLISIWITAGATAIQIGDTVDISGWVGGTPDFALVWDEIAAGSVRRDNSHQSHGTSSTPSDTITATAVESDIVGGISFGSTTLDTLLYSPDGTSYESGGLRQHTTKATSVHLVYRQAFAAGASTYAPTPLDGLGGPLSKAWQIAQVSLSDEAVTTRMLTMLGVGI